MIPRGGLLTVQNGTTQAYYANPVQYAPNGMTNSITLGNNLIEATTFNARFQSVPALGRNRNQRDMLLPLQHDRPLSRLRLHDLERTRPDGPGVER
jgi:hypothetical protein